MCVIVIKPAGVKMPNWDIIESCARRNPDGFGLATKNMTYKTLNILDFENHLADISDDDACILHFRWATHGSIKRANCHPFTDVSSGISFAHNGILDIEPIGDMTDSETAFKTILAPIAAKYGLASKELARASEMIRGASRFAFIDKNGQLAMYGPYYKMGGCFFSNLNFKIC